MGQTLFIEYDKQVVDQKLIEKNPSTALKLLISQELNGQSSRDFLHCVIRTVIPRNDNYLKRILYYYLETIGDDRSLVVCINQISKDLESPNEYVRGLVLNFISKLNSMDYISLLLKGVKNNLSNKNAYVRMDAVSCLATVAEKFEIDIEEELIAIAKQEPSPQVLKILFHGMHQLGIPIDQYLNVSFPSEVLETLISLSDDVTFLIGCTNLKDNSIVFKASNKILQLDVDEMGLSRERSVCSAEQTNSTSSKDDLKQINSTSIKTIGCINNGGELNAFGHIRSKCVDNIFRILLLDPSLKPDFIPSIRYVEGNSIDLLSLLDPYELEFSRCVIEKAFSNAETHEFVRVAEILYFRYIEIESASEKKRRYKILLLESMAAFSLSHCSYMPKMIPICIKNVGSDDAELVYASLKFLSAILNSGLAGEHSQEESDTSSTIIGHLISTFSSISQGKILRLIFDTIGSAMTKLQFESLLDALLENFNKQVAYLNDCEVFIGTHIALSIVSMYKKEWDLKEKTLGTLIRFLQYGSQHNTIDVSSRSTISLCIRFILNDKKQATDKGIYNFNSPSGSNATFSSTGTNISCLSPVNFQLLSCRPQRSQFEWSSPSDTTTDTVQLSGLGDPLYVEANISFNRYEITLDLLVVNQTDSYLQEISFDFISSKYVTLVSKNSPMSLQPSSATTIKVVFSISESSSCFISASALFKFPKDQEYSSAFAQNLNDINISISKFLEGATIDFKQHWKDLEWENIYSLTFGRAKPDLLLDRIISATNGVVCDRFSSFNFLVSNIACYTSQKALVLANICFSFGDSTVAEIRVRAKDEEIVKNAAAECVVPIYYARLEKIGGQGVIVEIDESKFGKRKYHRGHHMEGVWVVGVRTYHRIKNYS